MNVKFCVAGRHPAGWILAVALFFSFELSAGTFGPGRRLCYLLSSFSSSGASEQSFGSSAGSYFRNRLFDLADIFTVEFSAGELDAEACLTRYAALGAGIGRPGVIGWSFPRLCGVFEQGSWHADCLFLTAGRSVKRTISGTPVFIDCRTCGFFDAEEMQTLRHRDPWEIGIKAAGFFGIRFMIHPVEIADFFTGLIGIDIRSDDAP